MKKYAILIIITLVLIVANTNFVYASGTIVPDVNVTTTEEVIADKYSTDVYSFDTESMGVLDVVPAFINGLVGMFFMIHVLISRIINYAMVQAFTLDVFSYIEVLIDSMVHGLRDSIFVPMLAVILPCVGIYALINLLTGKVNKGINVLVQAVLVVIIAYGFMSTPAYFIGLVNDLSSEISTSILTSTEKVVNGTAASTNDESVVKLSNIYWTTAVVTPWKIIQFGKNVDDADAEKYLIATKDDRKTYADNESGTTFKKYGQFYRLALLFGLIIVNIAQSVMILFLSFLRLIAQFSALLATVIAVLSFTVALLPNMGASVAIRAIYNIFSYILTGLAAIMLFCMYFAIASVFYKSMGTLGYFAVIFLQMGLIITAIVQRKKLFSMVKATTQGAQAYNSEQSKSGAAQFLGSKAKSLALGYAAFRMGSDVKNMYDRRKDKRLSKHYKPYAEDYLYKRYDNEKRHAEKIARETGTAVEYSDFVKNADYRVDKGFKAFSVDQIEATTNMMKKIYKQREDPRRLMLTELGDKSDEQIVMSQAGVMERTARTKTELQMREARNEKKIDDIFGKAYDPRVKNRQAFYKQLFSKLPYEDPMDAPSDAQSIATQNDISLDGSQEDTYVSSQMDNIASRESEIISREEQITADGTSVSDAGVNQTIITDDKTKKTESASDVPGTSDPASAKTAEPVTSTQSASEKNAIDRNEKPVAHQKKDKQPENSTDGQTTEAQSVVETQSNHQDVIDKLRAVSSGAKKQKVATSQQQEKQIVVGDSNKQEVLKHDTNVSIEETQAKTERHDIKDFDSDTKAQVENDTISQTESESYAPWENYIKASNESGDTNKVSHVSINKENTTTQKSKEVVIVDQNEKTIKNDDASVQIVRNKTITTETKRSNPKIEYVDGAVNEVTHDNGAPSIKIPNYKTEEQNTTTEEVKNTKQTVEVNQTHTKTVQENQQVEVNQNIQQTVDVSKNVDVRKNINVRKNIKEQGTVKTRNQRFKVADRSRITQKVADNKKTTPKPNKKK